MRTVRRRGLCGGLGVLSILVTLSAIAGIECSSLPSPPATPDGDAAATDGTVASEDSSSPSKNEASADSEPAADSTADATIDGAISDDSGLPIDGGIDATTDGSVHSDSGTIDGGADSEPSAVDGSTDASIDGTVPSDSGLPIDGGTDGTTLVDSGSSIDGGGDARPQGDASDAAGCAAGETECSGTCVNEETDPNNCGGCGVTCGGACGGGVCRTAVCGDGIVETSEQCDFGNGNNVTGSGCEPDCQFSCQTSPDTCSNDDICVTSPMRCETDTGANGGAGQKCQAVAAVPQCGDCAPTGVCVSRHCATSLCGDGCVDPRRGEQCDPPNGTTCDSNCQIF